MAFAILLFAAGIAIAEPNADDLDCSKERDRAVTLIAKIKQRMATRDKNECADCAEALKIAEQNKADAEECMKELGIPSEAMPEPLVAVASRDDCRATRPQSGVRELDCYRAYEEIGRDAQQVCGRMQGRDYTDCLKQHQKTAQWEREDCDKRMANAAALYREKLDAWREKCGKFDFTERILNTGPAKFLSITTGLKDPFYQVLSYAGKIPAQISIAGKIVTVLQVLDTGIAILEVRDDYKKLYKRLPDLGSRTCMPEDGGCWKDMKGDYAEVLETEAEMGKNIDRAKPKFLGGLVFPKRSKEKGS